MIDPEVFDLKIGYVKPRTPIALASMAGITSAKFAKQFSGCVGIVALGGYNLDDKTNEAAKKIVNRGRLEFLSDDPLNFIEGELKTLQNSTGVAINARGARIDSYVKAARLAKEYKAILEIDAHCRQPEMIEIGAGEALLCNPSRLEELIREVKETGVVLSIKTRAGVVDDVELAKIIEAAGADIIHIDTMGEPRSIKSIRNATGLFIIGNNSVVDFERAKNMFSYGADMVSIARAALKNPDIIRQIAEETAAVQELTGWYNAPKHICGGGDLRALAFCCLPVKPCALFVALNMIGLTPEEFMKIKLEFARGTPIEYGEGTCFGSMTWCCKITKPCYLRDGALANIGLSDVEYMQIKKRLSEYILQHRKK